MRERAVELGGGCVVEAAKGGGTVVRVWLPLSAPVLRLAADGGSPTG
jgi:nitrate/nitrite-specific signal transduction histidine kinase